MAVPNAVKNARDRIAEAPELARQIKASLAVRLQEIADDPMLSDQYKADLADRAREKASATRADLAELVATDEATVREWVGKVEAGAKGSTSEERMLAELVEARGWDRARSMLDAGMRLHEVIARAAEMGDTAMLAGIRAELPAHLTANARGMDVSAGIAAARLEVDRVAGPLIGGDLADAREVAATFTQESRLASLAVEHAGEHLAGVGSVLERSIVAEYATTDLEVRASIWADGHPGLEELLGGGTPAPITSDAGAAA